jgi:hypothetical protein
MNSGLNKIVRSICNLKYAIFNLQLGGILLLGCVFNRLDAQETQLPPQLNPWCMFEPGAWKTVRVVTENFNEQGAVSGISTSENKTTLLDEDEQCVTLEVKVTVEVAGKRFNNEPQTIKQCLHGEQPTASLKLKDPTTGQVTIDDRKIPCQIRQIESSTANSKTTITVYYTTNVPPYLLKRDSLTTDLEGKNILNETNLLVQALEMPCRILGVMHSTAYVKTVQKTPKGTSFTLAVVCPEIPGGIVSHSSKEHDPSGRLVRRSTLELIDFDAEGDRDRSGTFNRKRPARYRGK